MSNEIIDRLKLESYKDKLILNKPTDIKGLEVLSADGEVRGEKYDLILIFVFSLDEFMNKLQQVISSDLINPNGFLAFIYPKKGNKKYKEYIGRDDFFTRVESDDDGYIKGSLLRFIKMAAFDQTFTLIGLKNQEKRKDRSNQLSQCVGDYIDRIPDLQKHFAKEEDVLSFFNNLTPGYQRGWARFVYSTKSETTISKRLVDMADMIRQGYKSIDLYRASKR